MAKGDHVDVSEEIHPSVSTLSQPPQTHAPPPPTPAVVLPAYFGALPTHLPPPASSGAPPPPASSTSAATNDQARNAALEGTVNQMATNMAELLALLRGPNWASSSSTPPPGSGPTHVMSALPPVSKSAPAMAYTVPPPTVFLASTAPAPTHLQATELPPHPSLQPHAGLSYQAPPPINTTFHEPGTPTHAAQLASSMHFFPEADAEQERRLKRMEETIRALQAGDARPDAGHGDGSLFPDMRLPPKFKSRNSRHTKARRIQRHHLRHYRGKMLQYWEYEEFVIYSFQDSLSGSALDWFMSLKAEDIPTWEDLSRKAGKKLDLGIKLGRMEDPTNKGEESSKKVFAISSSSSGRRGKEITVNTVNAAQQAPQQYSMNYAAAPPVAPSYAPHAPQYRPQTPTQPLYYSALPPPSLPTVSSPVVHHYAPAPSQAPQYQPPVPRTSQPTQRASPPQGQQGGAAQPRPRRQYPALPVPLSHIYRQIRDKANPLLDHGPAQGPSINMITVCTSSEGEGEQGWPSPFVIEYVPTEVAVGFAGIDAPHAPLVIDVLAREPYSDDRVPWTYEGGRLYENPATTDKGKAPATEEETRPRTLPTPSKKVTEEEAEAFMKVIKAREYKVVEQMAKSPAHISLLALLLNSEPHREALMRVLTAAQKVKFIVEEKIITVKGEDDYAIYKETAVPYISVGDDENLPFHSFETISVIRDYGEVGPSRADRIIGKENEELNNWTSVLRYSAVIADVLHSNPNLRRVGSNPSEDCLGEPGSIYFGEGLDEDSLVPEIQESLRRLEDRQLTSLEPKEEINVGTEEEPRILKIGIGAVLISPDGHYYPVAAKIDFPCTNNVAEYEACILGLQAAIDFKVKELEVFGDSMLTIFQTLEQWKTKDAKLVPYHEYLEKLTENFEDISFTYTPRMTNQFADALATLASMVSITKENLIEPLEIEIAEGPAHCNSIEASEAKPWYEDIKNLLRTDQYPPFANRRDRKTLRRLAIHYFLSGEILYHRSFDSTPPNSTRFPEGRFSGHERPPASLRGTSTRNRDHNDPRAPHNEPRAPQDIQGTLRKSRSQGSRSSRAYGPRPRATSQRSPTGQSPSKILSTPAHSHPFVRPKPRPKPAKTAGKPPGIPVCLGLGTFGFAHGHLDPPLRSPTSPTLHRAVTGSSVPSRLPEIAAAALSPGSPTRDTQIESCDSRGHFPGSLPRVSRLGNILLRLREVRTLVICLYEMLI
ncbi:hypothetical protein CRG98_020417 [Punica granatum]|uniref:RNase H type-1 domain-containing protein n=1 Tax=Punica granatum TaxID=22663 RepID=A0A2I0JSA0_PUNGR|nr:hypothetical protein CRG98_020417 [Punica granatum]